MENNNGYSEMVIGGSNAVSESFPSHFQLKPDALPEN